MKNVLIGSTTVMLLAVILWLIWPETTHKTSSKQPNTVSFSGDLHKVAKPSLPIETKPIVEAKNSIKELAVSDPYLTKAPKELTYMDVYRSRFSVHLIKLLGFSSS